MELPEPDVPIYLRRDSLDDGAPPAMEFRRERPAADVSRKALDTYRGAGDNAVSLLEDARILASAGRYARAFALACTALEEVGKSQYAADVYTGFVPPDDFEKIIRKHEFKSAYPSRYVALGALIQPFLKDGHIAEELFRRRNEALYASPGHQIDDAVFEEDAATLIDYVATWIDRINRQEHIAERIGTKAFLK